MKPKLHIYNNVELLIPALGETFKQMVETACDRGSLLHIALPGGTTPKKFFEYLRGPISHDIYWQSLHFYWGDERCVPPDHAQSNYGMVAAALLDHIDIPSTHIHRIHGECPPENEVMRYAAEINSTVPMNTLNLPQFDWIILGLGTDGHIASLFPSDKKVQSPDKICLIATHPDGIQKRISITLPVINNARRVSFLITGKAKATVVASILRDDPASKQWPAAQVSPQSGLFEWYLDKAAASLL